jgi:hypothetical protein
LYPIEFELEILFEIIDSSCIAVSMPDFIIENITEAPLLVGMSNFYARVKENIRPSDYARHV